MLIRSYVSTDRDAVLGLVPRLSAGKPEWRDTERWQQAFERWVTGAIDSATDTVGGESGGPSAVFVAEEPSGSVVGFVHVEPGAHFTGEPEAYVGELAVATSHARQGVGRALLAAVRDWAVEHGFERLALHAASGSPEALAFYQASGFRSESAYLTAPTAAVPGAALAEDDVPG